MDQVLGLTEDSVLIADSESGEQDTVAVGDNLTKMQTLPDGSLLVVGTGIGGPTSWIVDPASGSVTPIGLDGSAPTPWSEVAVDGQGRGVLLDQAIGQSVVRTINATDPANGIVTNVTTTAVPTDTQVLSSNTGSRSVFAWTGSEGLQAQLWSNVTNSFISANAIDLDGTVGLLSYDDASGLLAARNANGGVNIYDVDANFATLHTLNNVDGPVAIDGPRELLLSLSPVDTALRLINLRDGALIADFALELSSIGAVASLALDPNSDHRSDSMAVLGAAGIAEIALDRSTAHEVTIADGIAPTPLLFGVAHQGDNDAPEYEKVPRFQTNEDTTLIRSAPAALEVSFDANLDEFVLVQLTDASNGTVTARVDGSLVYTPDPNFNGLDSFEVLLHDGRDASDPYEIKINVLPVPDPPDGVIIDLPPISELVLDGAPIGTIEVIDVDGGGHTIAIDDDRFGIRGNDIIFMGGDIDFINEPTINLTISVTDPETGEVIEEIYAASVREETDVLQIDPDEADVYENDPGAEVAKIEVRSGQPVTLTVDDGRFEILADDTLKLKDDVALDFEMQQSIVVQITATGTNDGQKLTEPVTINVIDVAETPSNISLSGDSVLELFPGDIVGEVTIDGLDPRSYHSLSVNDPRFEIVDGTLKLNDRQMVERANQSQIEITITATLTGQQNGSVSEDFVLDVLENSAPFHNHENPYDVDHSQRVTAADALVIINFLNSFGPGPPDRGTANHCYDVNADSLVTALDALLVLNELARMENGSGTVGGEPEPEENPNRSNGPAPEGEQLPEEYGTSEQYGISDEQGISEERSTGVVSFDGNDTGSAASDQALLDLTSDDAPKPKPLEDDLDLLSDD